MSDTLLEYLSALERDSCYRVDKVLKNTPVETTQRVYFVGRNGAETGPYVRKLLSAQSGLGNAYKRIWEAQRAGQRFLHLPRIIECYDADDAQVVVMEHIEGRTLAEEVFAKDPSPSLALELFPRICDAVFELHTRFDPPLIHRDLKPSNIMVTNGWPTIIDFGIARTFNDEAEEDTRRFGTRAYAPPEQFGYSQTDERSDVYALGLILYFCLTEKTPDSKARSRGYADARIPDPLSAVIMRATAFDPKDRYGSAQELREAFLLAATEIETLPADSTQCTGKKASASDKDAEPAASDAKDGTRFQTDHDRAAKPLRSHEGMQGLSRKMGIARNALVAATFAMFFLVATQMVFEPSPDQIDAHAPLAVRALINYSIVFPLLGPLFYLALDKRRLKGRLSRLASLTKRREVALCLAICAIGFALTAFATSLIP